ncbi:MAG: Xaa-Pro dipeptidase, partial [Proteobacteria bacterium]
MRRVCAASAATHRHVMQFVRPGMNEFEVASELEYHFRKNGCDSLGYGSIVAGGKNATCLHYKTNNENLRDGDLLLIDAGGERELYGADITRTFPVGRKFTDAQSKIYDLVLQAQSDCLALAKPGATLPQIHSRAIETLTDGMIEYGFLKGKRAELISTAAYRKYYPHGTSHWLGMDVHDVGLMLKDGQPRRLEPGMVFTIEPGFYVQPSDQDAPQEFKNIGIRIEDDVLITDAGCENLTTGVPKLRSEIEALRQY